MTLLELVVLTNVHYTEEVATRIVFRLNNGNERL